MRCCNFTFFDCVSVKSVGSVSVRYDDNIVCVCFSNVCNSCVSECANVRSCVIICALSCIYDDDVCVSYSVSICCTRCVSASMFEHTNACAAKCVVVGDECVCVVCVSRRMIMLHTSCRQCDDDDDDSQRK